jgi:predicted nuclease with TOPRIM domain
MDFANFEEFWKALGRLYDSTLKNTEDIRELRASIGELRQSTEELRDASQHLLNAVEKHQIVVEAHERRLDRTEITVDAILEDLRRHREGRSPQ